ncbi:MAG TPA: signal peptidase I [Streptosporangiaceae bacterium]|nr:signal peptidase I [Streptosporangiaceae bacterium]
MSPSSSRDGDSPAVIAGGPPQHRPASSAAADGAGRPGRNVAAHRPAAVRSPQELDYRLRGLSTDPADYVSTAPTRPDRRRRPRRHGPFLAKVAVLVAVAALAAWLLPAFAVQSFSVPSAAMAPTLQAGDRILVAKGLLAGSVHSGEIVVFRPPHFLPCTVVGGGGDLVLRVVARPGQTIWSIGNTIFVDGRPLREQGWYDPRFGQVGSRPIPSTTLVQNQYYVLGDNRSGSCDSRVFGPISGSSIVGEGIAVVVRDGHVFLRKL